MTEFLTVDGGTLAYDVTGTTGPLVVLAHGMGDSREAYRFLTPALVEAGYRVAAVDLRGCGESSAEWPSYSRTDIAGDLVPHGEGELAAIGVRATGQVLVVGGVHPRGAHLDRHLAAAGRRYVGLHQSQVVQSGAEVRRDPPLRHGATQPRRPVRRTTSWGGVLDSCG